MSDPSSIALINFAAAVLVFLAAIIPLSYGIWRRAKETNSEYKVIMIALSACSIVLYASGLIWGWSRGANFAVFLLFCGGFAFYALYFYIQRTPADRQSILILVVQSMLIVTTLLLYFMGRLLSALGAPNV